MLVLNPTSVVATNALNAPPDAYLVGTPQTPATPVPPEAGYSFVTEACGGIGDLATAARGAVNAQGQSLYGVEYMEAVAELGQYTMGAATAAPASAAAAATATTGSAAQAASDMPSGEADKTRSSDAPSVAERRGHSVSLITTSTAASSAGGVADGHLLQGAAMHVFGVAERASAAACADGRSRCIVVTGEEHGCGRTSTAMHLVRLCHYPPCVLRPPVSCLTPPTLLYFSCATSCSVAPPLQMWQRLHRCPPWRRMFTLPTRRLVP